MTENPILAHWLFNWKPRHRIILFIYGHYTNW